MDGLNLLKNIIFKNKSLLRQIRPLHVSSARAFKPVAPRESLNSDFVLDLHYEFHYRDQAPFDAWDKKKNTIADISMGIILAFVIYKIYDEPTHITGEFEYPDYNQWTDEELGVPPIN